MNDMPIEDMIILRNIIHEAQIETNEALSKYDEGKAPQHIMDKLRAIFRAIIIINGPISEWYKTNESCDKEN